MIIEDFFFYLFVIVGICLFTIGSLSENNKLYKSGIAVFLCAIAIYMIQSYP